MNRIEQVNLLLEAAACRRPVKGYTWNKVTRKWHASIYFDGHRQHLGCFDNETDAAEAYKKAAAAINRTSFNRCLRQPIFRSTPEGEIVEIPLTQNKTAVIDASDAEVVLGYTWYAFKSYLTFYARTNIPSSGGKKMALMMHRLILSPPENVQVDHRNGNGLDNRRSNLRLAHNSQQQANTWRPATNTSGHKGVSWDKVRGKWRAQIKIGQKSKSLGHFSSKEEAAAAYDTAAVRYFGEFARTNQTISQA